MGFGLSIKNSNDNSLVLSANSLNSFFVGRGVFYRWFGPQSSLYVNTYTYHFWYDLPAYNPQVVPIFFIKPGTGTGYYDTEIIAFDSERANWIVRLMTNSNVYPDIYTFLPSSEMSGTTGNYGLQLKDDFGNITFDSRWGKRLLTVDRVIPTTASPGNSYNYPSLAHPAFLYSSKYVRGTFNGVWQYMYSQGVKITDTNITFGEIDNYNWKYPQNPVQGIWGDNDQQIIPIIDCTKYI